MTQAESVLFCSAIIVPKSTVLGREDERSFLSCPCPPMVPLGPWHLVCLSEAYSSILLSYKLPESQDIDQLRKQNEL